MEKPNRDICVGNPCNRQARHKVTFMWQTDIRTEKLCSVHFDVLLGNLDHYDHLVENAEVCKHEPV